MADMSRRTPQPGGGSSDNGSPGNGGTGTVGKSLDQAVASGDVNILVPGNPEEFHRLAAEMRKEERTMAAGKTRLEGVDAESWTGQAGQGGRGQIRAVESGYGRYLFALSRAADAMTNHGHALVRA